MEHAREIELIELTAGRLEAERERVVRAHVEDCPTCQAKLQDIQRTWDLLGAWQVQPAMRVDVAKVGTPSRAHEQRSGAFIIRFPSIRVVTRIAAAIGVSVLIGYTGGRWSVHPPPTGSRPEPPPYFSVLGSDIGDSFSSLVLQDGPSSSQES